VASGSRSGAYFGGSNPRTGKLANRPGGQPRRLVDACDAGATVTAEQRLMKLEQRTRQLTPSLRHLSYGRVIAQPG
jgi:hypothetical protein